MLAGVPSAKRLPVVKQQRLVVDVAGYGDNPFDAAPQALAKQIGAFLRSAS